MTTLDELQMQSKNILNDHMTKTGFNKNSLAKAMNVDEKTIRRDLSLNHSSNFKSLNKIADFFNIALVVTVVSKALINENNETSGG